jgi:hypothetical protein
VQGSLISLFGSLFVAILCWYHPTGALALAVLSLTIVILNAGLYAAVVRRLGWVQIVPALCLHTLYFINAALALCYGMITQRRVERDSLPNQSPVDLATLVPVPAPNVLRSTPRVQSEESV